MAPRPAPAYGVRMRQDPTFKDIFAYPFMAEELVRWLAGGPGAARDLVGALDFARLERVPEQSTTGPAQAKRGRANDIVWRVPLRDGEARDGGWLHLVVMIEVQAQVDHLMALRIRNYVDNHHMEVWRGARFGAKDRLAPVLPVVFYTGLPRWTAASRVIDLVTPSAGPGAGLGAESGAGFGAESRRSGLLAGDGYLALDTRRLGADDVRFDNAASLLAGLCNPKPESLPAQVAALRARLDAPPLRPLLEVMLLWAQRTAERVLGIDLGVDDMAEADSLHEDCGELEAHFALRRRVYQHRYRKEGMARGMERGLEKGIAAERDLLHRQASRKFGTDPRVGPLLAGVADTEALATVGEWIIDCGTLEELLARLDGLA